MKLASMVSLMLKFLFCLKSGLCLAGCLDPLLALLGYPAGSNTADLSSGSLLLRHCITPFATRFPLGL